jgi:hypothetical protein
MVGKREKQTFASVFDLRGLRVRRRQRAGDALWVVSRALKVKLTLEWKVREAGSANILPGSGQSTLCLRFLLAQTYSDPVSGNSMLATDYQSAPHF